MPYNASGVFSIINTFIPGTVILSSTVNQNYSDVATGLSTAILKDGTQIITANIPLSGFKLTNLAAGTASTDSVRFGQVGTLSGNNVWTGTQTFSNTVTINSTLALTGAETITLAAAGTALTIASTDAGATSGPDFELYRNSASPAASDVLSTMFWYGKDSAGNKQEYFSEYTTILDATSTTEDANKIFKAAIAGASTVVATLGPGLQVGTAPTSGDLGLGTVNAAVAYYAAGRPLEPIAVGVGNYTLVASVATNALTVALKTLSGGDPSATDPVSLSFRSATNATGTSIDRTLTAAASIVVASTKTLGTLSSNVPFRIWIVAVDTGSSIELGVINCRSGTTIFPLRDDLLYSPTATPGNSAQVIYTTTGQTSKPTRVIGYMDWGTGLTTAGTWASGPTKIQLFSHGVPLPNYIVQTVATITGTSATGTTTLPSDNTIPQSTEGDQYMSLAISNIAAPNLLMVSAQIAAIATSAGGAAASMALFQDSTANALAVASAITTSGAAGLSINDFAILAGSSSPTTFKVRAGYNGAGTTTFNGSGGTQLFGGVLNSNITIREVMA